MTIHPLPADGSVSLRPQQARPDSASAYDSTWAESAPAQGPVGLEQFMLDDGKIYVVLAVVLIIWAGLLLVLFRTDRRIDTLERRVDRDISTDEDVPDEA